MLTISRAQQAALARVQLARFEAAVCDHLRAAAPDLVAGAGPDGLEAFVSAAVARARGHGLEAERDLAGWVELALRWGPAFDADPALPFAARIVQEREVHERAPTLARLREAEARAAARREGEPSS